MFKNVKIVFLFFITCMISSVCNFMITGTMNYGFFIFAWVGIFLSGIKYRNSPLTTIEKIYLPVLVFVLILTAIFTANYNEFDISDYVDFVIPICIGLPFIFCVIDDNLRVLKFEEIVDKKSEEHLKQVEGAQTLIRQDALNMVSKYLVLNGSIWKNLKIINQHCSIELKKNGKTIVIKELEGDLRWSEFIDIYNKDLINSFCYNFDEETTYDDLLKLRDELNVSVLDSSEKKKKFSKKKEKFEVEEAEPKLNDDRNVDL